MEPIRRICLTGPESTGKSELVSAIAEKLGTAWVPEYAREYALRAGRPLTVADVEPIARGQMANEDRGAPQARGVLLLDTDLISTIVYSRYCYGTCPPWIVEEARRRRADLYLLMDIDVPWIPDPAREGGPDRTALIDAFRGALEEFGARYEIIGGSWVERARKAWEAISQAAR